MSESSWFFKSAWASTYFRRAPEGLIFTCPSPWIFGRSREYRLTDAQAEELVARIGRAYVKGMFVMGGGMVLLVLGVLAYRPIAPAIPAVVITLLLAGACLGIVYRAVGSMLAGLSWTSAPREPYSPVGNLKKANAILMTLPTWALAVLAGVPLISSVAMICTALASGQANLDVWNVGFQFILSGVFGIALVTKLRAR